MKTLFSIAIVLAVTLCPAILTASGPIGVYALVDKVTFEPSADKPARIRISGVFSVAEDNPTNAAVYSAPQRGILYFTLPGDNQDLALREWNDLKSVAGTRQVVGFGASWGAKVHVRKSEADANLAEEFPMGNGLVKVNADQPRAAALLEYKDR